MVGEKPGDREDLAGKLFACPSGIFLELSKGKNSSPSTPAVVASRCLFHRTFCFNQSLAFSACCGRPELCFVRKRPKSERMTIMAPRISRVPG